MANCLLDFIEMTECISTELRSQLTSIRELDLQVNNAMDDLEKNIEQFFSNVGPLSQEERQKKFSALLSKCDIAFAASDDKVKVADKLHDLIEKMTRSLDQNLDKLKEDLLEGDKAYIVEDIERKSQELDESMRIEQEDFLAAQRQSSNSKHNRKHTSEFSSNSFYNQSESTAGKSINLARNSTNHRNSYSGHNCATGNDSQRKRKKRDSSDAPVGRPRKRERKRSNDSPSLFNSNPSLIDDDDTTINNGMDFSNLPLTPDLVTSRKSSAFNDILGNDSELGKGGAIAGNQHHKNLAGVHDRSNGSLQQIGAKQTILIPTDASNKKGRMQSIDSNLPLNQNHSTLSSALSSSVTTNSQQMVNSSTNSPITSLPFSWNIWCSPLGNHQQVQLAANTPLISRDETKYCICRQVSYGEMVACDNDECEIEWFHYDCVGITHPPKGKWFCPDCSRKKR